MNPDLENDWLDRALRTRTAMKPPADFTRTVLNRVAANEPRGLAAFIAEEGVRVGLALAGAGFLSIADAGEMGRAIERAVATDAAAVVAVMLSLTWFVLSRRAAEA